MKYRKKPIIVKAEQWFPGKEITGVITKSENISIAIAPNETGIYEQIAWVETLEGKMIVSEGDYVITGIAGEKYPCKKSIFEATYEKVEE